MQQFSPGMRKFLALATLLLTLLLVWNIFVGPVASQMGASLTKLQDARFQRMRLEQLAAQPAPQQSEPLPIEILVVAETPEEASAQITAYLNGLATQNNLQVANITPHLGLKGAKLLAFDLTLVGEEVALVSFINELERGAPVIRLKSWQIDGPELTGGGSPVDAAAANDPANPNLSGNSNDQSIRFSGQAVAAWIKP